MKPETRSFYALAVQRAVARVEAELDRALDLEALARGAGLSPFHFHRVFRGMLGETPLELHRRLRMERAAWSLLHGDAPITSIAFAAGYETHESFTRAFRTHYDASPSQFRQDRSHGRPGCERALRFELPARSGIHYRTTVGEPRALHFDHKGTTMNVQIEARPELRVATVRHVGPYNRISSAFARLGEIAGASGLIGAASEMLAIYHDDPETTPEGELRSDAALVVRPDALLPESLGEQRLPAGPYARTVHVGPYEQLGDAWGRLMGEWLPSSGHRVGEGSSYEIYRNTPAEVPPEELVTELYVPLAPT